MTTQEHFNTIEEFLDKTMFFPEYKVGSLWKLNNVLPTSTLTEHSSKILCLQKGEVIMIAERKIGVFACKILSANNLLYVNTASLANSKAEELL